MPDPLPSTGPPALVASVSGNSVSFATASDGDGLRADSQRTYSCDATPTFTDAVQRYARETGIRLDGTQLVLSVAGAVRGDTLRVTNGRWFISLRGLESVLRRPPLALNDVSAVAWSTLLLGSADLRPLDAVAGAVRGTKVRSAVVWVGDGLGACCLAWDDAGRPFVLDGEAGHMTCPLDTAEQRAVLEPVRDRFGHLSYERALGHLFALRDGPASARPADPKRLGLEVLASFVGDVALAFGAWGGVHLAGPGVQKLLRTGSGESVAFRTRLAAKGRMRGALGAAPVWITERSDLPLLGALACLRAREGR